MIFRGFFFLNFMVEFIWLLVIIFFFDIDVGVRIENAKLEGKYFFDKMKFIYIK